MQTPCRQRNVQRRALATRTVCNLFGVEGLLNAKPLLPAQPLHPLASETGNHQPRLLRQRVLRSKPRSDFPFSKQPYIPWHCILFMLAGKAKTHADIDVVVFSFQALTIPTCVLQARAVTLPSSSRRRSFRTG